MSPSKVLLLLLCLFSFLFSFSSSTKCHSLECRRMNEDCRRNCELATDPLLAKCTTVAAFVAPVMGNLFAMASLPFVGAFFTSILAAISPVCEGLNVCNHCGQGRNNRDIVMAVEGVNETVIKLVEVNRRMDERILSPLTKLAEALENAWDDTVIDFGLANAYQKSWNGLATNEMIYAHVGESGKIKDLFVEIVTKNTGDKNLEFIVYTFSEMIRGELSYFELSPSKFCKEGVITSLLRAQFKAREMLIYLGIITKDPGMSAEKLRNEFAEEQQRQNEYIIEVCGRSQNLPEAQIRLYKSAITNAIPKKAASAEDEEDRTKRKAVNYLFKLKHYFMPSKLHPETSSANYSSSDHCHYKCKNVIDDLTVWCEGLFVFGANFICAAMMLPGVDLGCTVGNFVGKSSAVSAYCATDELFDVCQKCGDPTTIGDVLEKIERMDMDAKNLSMSIQNVSMVGDRLFDLKSNLKKGFRTLRDEHFVTNTYGRMLREIRFLDKKFSRVQFASSDGAPVRDHAFRKFVTHETLVNVFELMADFYTMVNGYPRYHPFHIRSLVEVNKSYCSVEIVQGLEKTQLKLIYIFNFLSKSLRVPKIEVQSVNKMIRGWRERQIEHVKEVCNEGSARDQPSPVAKFIAVEC